MQNNRNKDAGYDGGFAKSTSCDLGNTNCAIDLNKAIQMIQQRQGWLERCMLALSITLPKALVWQRMHNVHKALFQILSTSSVNKLIIKDVNEIFQLHNS